MSIKLFNYSGTKYPFVNEINKIIHHSKKSIYVEPFVGSGAVFLNLRKEFDEYIINDIDSNVIRIWTSIKNSTHNDLCDFAKSMNERFGNMRVKTNYYTFREYFNSELWKTDTIEEGFGILVLYGACINSMARWGPNGFNQGYGNRNSLIDKEDYRIAKLLLSKTKIMNIDFFEMSNLIDHQNSLIFADPPYFQKGSSYKNMSHDSYHKMLSIFEQSPADIIYTDIDHNDISFRKIILRQQMINTAPGDGAKLDRIEMLFTNIVLPEEKKRSSFASIFAK